MSRMPPRSANSPCSSAGSSRAEAGVDEQLGQLGRRDVLTRTQVQRRRQHMLRGADARQQRGRGRHDDARGAAGQRMKRVGANRRDADVGRHAPIGIDFVRRNRQDRPVDRGFRQSFERGQKEPDVGDDGVELAVARHDIQHHAFGQRVGGRRHHQRFARRAEAGDGAGGHVEAAPRNRGLENGAKIQRGRGGHRGGLAIFSMMLVVE